MKIVFEHILSHGRILSILWEYKIGILGLTAKLVFRLQIYAKGKAFKAMKFGIVKKCIFDLTLHLYMR